MESKRQNLMFKTLGEFLFKEFFDSLYKRASSTLSGDQSITENYIHLLSKYMICVTEDIKCYKAFLESLFKFYSEKHSVSFPFSTFLDKLAENFFPTKYEHLFTKDHKDEILSVVITSLVNSIGRFISKPTCMRYVIDERKKQRDVLEEMVITEAVAILELKKLEYSSKFISKVSNETTTDADFLRHTNEKLYKENDALRAELEHYKAIASTVEKLKAKEAKYERLIFALHDTKTKLETKIEMLSRVPVERFDGVSIQHVVEPVARPSLDVVVTEVVSLTSANVEKVPEEKKINLVNNYISTSDTKKNMPTDDDECVPCQLDEVSEFNLSEGE